MNFNNIPFIAGTWPPDPSLSTIIFIHGAGNSKNLWRSQIEGLSGFINTIAVDLPGHGENQDNGMASIENYAGFVEKFIAGINPPSPVPCGISMGGAITLKMLLNPSVRFTAGIAVNSGARLKVMPEIFEMVKNNYRGFTSSLKSIGASPLTDPLKLQEITADTENCSPDVVFNDFTACSKYDITEQLNRINIPVLVLTAEDDKLTPFKVGKFLADNISGSSHVHISEAGHFSPVEKPDEINNAIIRFIKSLK